MTWKTAGPAKTMDQFGGASFIARKLWIKFVEGVFHKQIGNYRGSAMTGADNKQDARLVLVNQIIEMALDKIQAGNGAPMPKDAVFEMLFFDWFSV